MAVQPAEWLVGPPPPRMMKLAARVMQVTTVLVLLIWLFRELGGFSLSPVVTTPGANDTGPLFNWHPLLMTLGFLVLMAEGVIAFRAPLAGECLSRAARKRVHWAMHLAAALASAVGLIASILSHTMKLPTPLPNFYSTHSWVGLAALVGMVIQICVGIYAYLGSGMSIPNKKALMPIHAFFGMFTFLTGVAAMMLGIQEKTTFVQMTKPGVTVTDAVIRIPALLQLCVLLTTALLMYNFAPSARESHATQVRMLDNEALDLLEREEQRSD